jgi:hypothetical protein
MTGKITRAEYYSSKVAFDLAHKGYTLFGADFRGANL